MYSFSVHEFRERESERGQSSSTIIFLFFAYLHCFIIPNHRGTVDIFKPLIVFSVIFILKNLNHIIIRKRGAVQNKKTI